MAIFNSYVSSPEGISEPPTDIFSTCGEGQDQGLWNFTSADGLLGFQLALYLLGALCASILVPLYLSNF